MIICNDKKSCTNVQELLKTATSNFTQSNTDKYGKMETVLKESENLEDFLSELDIDVWRERFAKLLVEYRQEYRTILYKSLMKVDDYYKTAEGAVILERIIYKRCADIKAVARATKALEKFLSIKTEPQP